MNILSGIITFILAIALAVVCLFFLLLALNGFTGKKAGEYAVYFYFVWAILFSLIFAAVSFGGTTLLLKKSMNKALSVIIPIFISTVLAGGIHFLGIIVSTIVAQEIWKK